MSLQKYHAARKRKRKRGTKKRKKGIPFLSMWLWCHCNRVRWTVKLETSDFRRLVAAASTRTNSLTAKRFPPLLNRVLGASETAAEIFPFLLLDLSEHFLDLDVLFDVDMQAPMMMTQILCCLTRECIILHMLCQPNRLKRSWHINLLKSLIKADLPLC